MVERSREKEKVKIGYKVEIDQWCIHSEHANEKYGHWEESYHNTFKGIRRLGPKDHSDVSSDLDIKPGEEVYVVWLQYSSGDSFGQGYYKYFDTLALFREYKYAEEFAKFVKEGDYNAYIEPGGYYPKYPSADGQIIEFYPSWTGYFETLETVDIEDTSMRKAQ